MKRSAIPLPLTALTLAGCEPVRGVISKKDVVGSVDIKCIDSALRKAFAQVSREDYTDDDDGGSYPSETQVAQFVYYSSPDNAGRATLEVGPVPSGTRLVHSFTGLGSELPQGHFPPALAAMRKASETLRAACNLDLTAMPLRSVGQHVDALD
jgi:hypothetical protein